MDVSKVRDGSVHFRNSEVKGLRGEQYAFLIDSYNSGPSCSKLTTLLVNDLLKFTSSDTQIC